MLRVHCDGHPSLVALPRRQDPISGVTDDRMLGRLRRAAAGMWTWVPWQGSEVKP